ncbi:MAG: uroporphyrinogen decarboxylase family protein [Planctomycetota bacterium]
MKQRDIVKATLEFNSPLRIPRQLWYLRWAEEHYPEQMKKIQQDFPDDIVSAPAVYKEKLKTKGDAYAVGEYIDEWGCIFESMQSGVFGQVKEPLLTNWQDIGKIRIPTEALTLDIDEVNSFCEKTDKFVLSACCPRIFERLQFIRKTENILIDFIDKPEELSVLISRIHNFYKEELNLWAKTKVDALCIMDDWGSQNSLMISPVMWREMFKPIYMDYSEIAHSNGKYLFMHSDGCIVDILPDLIEVGVDAINLQIFCMDVQTISERFAGKITFWGEVDRQNLLPYGTKEDIKNAVALLKESFYRNGGVIAQCEFGPGANPENVYAVFEEWANLKL